MQDISVVRSGDTVSSALPTFFYPTVVDIPLSAYLLHEDAKHHTELEFREQTAALIGSNAEIGDAITHGFQQSLILQAESNELLQQSNEQLAQLNGSLDRMIGKMGDIEDAVNRVSDTVERAGLAIVNAVSAVHLELVKLNRTATLVATMTANPELTWSRERASDASRAMVVGDLELAKQCCDYAINGHGSHTGAPTHVELLILAAEVRTRMGGESLAEASELLDRAKRYLALEPTSLLQARFQFARGAMLLRRHNDLGEAEHLEAAETAFRESCRDAAFSSIGAVYIAVVQTLRRAKADEIVDGLVAAIERRPQIAIEVWRLRGTKLSSSVVDRSISRSTASLFKKYDYSDKIRHRLDQIKVTRNEIEETMKFDTSFERYISALNGLENACLNFAQESMKRVENKSLMSATLLGRSCAKYDATYETYTRTLR